MAYNVQELIRLAAFLGGGASIGLGAIGAAIGEGYTGSEANKAISRSPKYAGAIVKAMLVGQAVAESASIFALVIAILLLFARQVLSRPKLVLQVPLKYRDPVYANKQSELPFAFVAQY